MATFTVSNLNDSGTGSLREAIALANAMAGADEINFSIAGLITLTSGQLAITQDITIDGDTDGDLKADITISGNNACRVVDISGAGTDVALRSLDIADGSAAALYAANGSTLSIVNSTVRDSANNSGGFYGVGGGIRAETLHIANSTLSGNAARYGGAVYVADGGTGIFDNVTVSGNIATVDGGGIGTGSGASLTIRNSTIFDNTAVADGGGVELFNGSTASVYNSIVSGNTAGGSGADVHKTGTGNNLEAGASLFGTTAGVDTNLGGSQYTDMPMLHGLADNGGPVQTHAPMAGSAAVGNGNASYLPADTLDVDDDGDTAETLPIDANGASRIQGGTLDIGAVEYAPSAIVVDNAGDVADGDYTSGNLTLREALTIAQGTPGADTIQIGGNIPLINTNSTLVIAAGEDVTINGDSDGDGIADVRLSGQMTHRVLTVEAGATAEIQALNILRGRDVGGTGATGASANGANGASGTPASPNGEDGDDGGTGGAGGIGGDAVGGIFNAGDLTLARVSLVGNVGVGGTGGVGGSADGGSGGSAGGYGGGYGGDGGDGGSGGSGGTGGAGGDAAGAILNDTGGVLTLIDTAFARRAITDSGRFTREANSAEGGDGGQGGSANGRSGGDTDGGGGSAGTPGDGGLGGMGGHAGIAVAGLLNRGTVTTLTTTAFALSDNGLAVIAGFGGAGGAADALFGPGGNGNDGTPGAPGNDGATHLTILDQAGGASSGPGGGAIDETIDTLIYLHGAPLAIVEADSGMTDVTVGVHRIGAFDNGATTASADWAVVAAGPGTTVDAADFVGGVLPSGTVTFSGNGVPGEVTQHITFSIASDALSEGDESFQIVLSNPTGSGAPDVGLGTAITQGTVLAKPYAVFSDAALTAPVADAGDFAAAQAAASSGHFIVKQAPQRLTGLVTQENITVVDNDAVTDSYVLSSVLQFSTVGSSNVVVHSDMSGDLVKTGEGDDRLHGGLGNDFFNGGLGSDVLNGDGGDDLLRVKESAVGDFDHLDGGADTDIASFEGFEDAVWIDLAYAQPSGIEAWTRDNATVTSGAWRGIADLRNIENVYGSAFADEIYGDAGANFLVGRAGTDTLFGRGGDDRILIEDGFDTVDGGGDTDTADFANYTTAVWVDLSYSGPTGFEAWTRGGTTVTTGPWQAIADLQNIENLGGSEFDDIFYGDAGVNVVNGSSGNDRFYIEAGLDIFDGGSAIDTADFSLYQFAVWVDLTYSGATGYEAFTRGGTTVTSGTWQAIADLSNAENLTGTAFDDMFFDDLDADNVFVTDAGADTIYLSGGLDTVSGGAGIDRVDFSEYATAIWVDLSYSGATGFEAWTTGGPSIDFMNWQAIANLSGIENVTGSSHDDHFRGDAGNNVFSGGAGADRFFVEEGLDDFDGGAGNDVADFSDYQHAVWVDLAYAQPSGFEAWTRGGPTVTSGTWQAIANLTDVENLVGSAFDDELLGDTDDNRMTGGNGSDRFKFKDGLGIDVITDFQDTGSGFEDLIDLSEHSAASSISDLSFSSYAMGTETGLLITVQTTSDSIAVLGLSLDDVADGTLAAEDFVF